MPEREPGAQDARRAFDAAGAFLRGHFIYTSGRHGADYLEKFRILEDPTATTALAAMIAQEFTPLRPELVAGPTTGGIILAFEVARQLPRGRIDHGKLLVAVDQRAAVTGHMLDDAHHAR